MTGGRHGRDMTIGGMILESGLPISNWPLLSVSSLGEWPKGEELLEEELDPGEEARLDDGDELQLLLFSFIMAVVEEAEVVVLVNLVAFDSFPDPTEDEPWWVLRWARRLQANANLLSHTLQTCGLSPAERKNTFV